MNRMSFAEIGGAQHFFALGLRRRDGAGVQDRCFDLGRNDHGGADAGGGLFHVDAVAHGDQCGLGRGVASASDVVEEVPGPGRDMDQYAVVPLAHHLYGRGGAVEGRGQIGAEYGIDRPGGQFVPAALAHVGARVVDQDVEPAFPGGDARGDVFGRGGLGNVAGHHQRLATLRADSKRQRLQRIGPAACQHHRRARARHGERRGLTDPAGGAGDPGNFVGERLHGPLLIRLGRRDFRLAAPDAVTRWSAYLPMQVATFSGVQTSRPV